MSGTMNACDAPPLSVLLIDDDYDDHVVTSQVLDQSDLNATLEWQPTYERGLAILREGTCDVCLLDYRLGGQAGLALLESLSAVGCNTPVIMLTGMNSADTGAAALRSGAADYLSRAELNPSSLTRAIRYAIERGRARAERERLEQKLRQAQKREAIGRLSGGIAHDINNILNVVIANVDLLRSTDVESSDYTESLSEIRNVTQRGATLVRKLLAYGRRDNIALRVIDLVPVIDEIARMLTRVLPESVDIDTSLPEGPLTVYGDSDAIHQILLNLATNARDAMPAGGRLRLSAKLTELDAHFCAERPGARVGQHVAIALADSGTGMDDETLDQVFEPFFTTKPEGEGTGLGLAMVFGLTKQMRGYLDVESKLGVGTTITVYLPFEPHVPVVQPAPPQARSVPLVGNETVLLVEDQLELRRAGRKILERAGYAVTAASDGRDGLRKYEELDGRVDIIVTDIVMPNIGGRELYELVSKTGRPPKFLFTSGYSAKHIGDQILTDQMPLLRKPWTLDELLRTVREVLDDGTPSGSASRFRRLTL